MDPKKLTKFSKDKVVPAVAKKYVCQIVSFEMLQGLMKYLHLELFPQIQIKAGKEVSLRSLLASL